MASIFRAYNNILNKRPLLTQAVSAGVLMASGDAISQFVIEKKSLQQYVPERGIRFFVFGTVFVGPPIRYWYLLLEKLVSKSRYQGGAFQKVVLDQLLFAPAFTAFFLSSMEYWKSQSFTSVKDKLKKSYVDILLVNYMIWPLAQVINFSFVPLLYRVIYVQILGVFWNTFLAYQSEIGGFNPSARLKKLIKCGDK